MDRPEWQQHLFVERHDLDEQITKLVGFIHGDQTSKELFRKLDIAEQALLRRQLALMIDYSAVLTSRIAHFKPTS